MPHTEDMSNAQTLYIGWANVGSKTHGNPTCSFRDYYNTPFVTSLDDVEPCGRCGGPTEEATTDTIEEAAKRYAKVNRNYKGPEAKARAAAEWMGNLFAGLDRYTGSNK